VTNAVTVENEYAVSEHGMEFIEGSTVPIYTEILYGANLKDKLKRDVLTISEQTLTGAQQAQVQRNLGVPSAASVNENIAKQRTAMSYVVDGNVSADAIPAGAYFQLVNSQITGRSDGEYTASKAIPANTAIDNTYFTQTAPISGGAVNALNSNLTVVRENCTINSTYLKEGDVVAFKIGNLVLVQLADLKFKSDIPSSAESNGIVLVTLPFAVSMSQVVFAVVQLSTTYSVIRLKIQGNAIYPWWSSIKETTGEGYSGNVIINIPI